MTSRSYQRTFEELEQVASSFWSADLTEQEAALSIIPRLVETQDDFISILRVPVEKIDNLFQIIRASRLPGNLFLKHLIVLADFGGEILQRVNDRFSRLFPNR
jgi:hypothetical protein